MHVFLCTHFLISLAFYVFYQTHVPFDDPSCIQYVQPTSYRQHVIISLGKLPNSNREVTRCGDIPQQVERGCVVQKNPSHLITSLG